MENKKYYCTDSLMIKLWGCLVRDFRTFEGPNYCQKEEKLLSKSVKDFRAHKWPARSQAPVNVFKQQVQLENLFKRYRFKDDAYTAEELEVRTFAAFTEHQCALRDTNENVSISTYNVVQRARALVKSILGPYDLNEHVEACRFGVKANLGVPAAKAYLDVKLSTLSGSDEHWAWFNKHVVKDDPILESLVDSFSDILPEYRQTGNDFSLAMVNVPKSWMILRGIIPDTVLGSFFSNGIGTMIQRRLHHRAGLNIRRLQAKHRRLARKYSKTRTHVTADLRNASNSYTWSVLCRLVPREWLQVLDFGRARRYSFKQKDYLNMSFMMMGIGFTFPLQTLLFYCLIRAVGDLLGQDREDVVSVYGDDLIYPVTYHRYVTKVLSDLGFTLNSDKTYVKDHFRESCGGDYYHGADVRPFSPNAEHQVLRAKPYVLFLYKTLNGLLSRWTEFDIPQTVRFLLLEILRVENKIVMVPSEFPDFSGLHISKAKLDFLWPTVKPRINLDTWRLDVFRYELKPRSRVIISHIPYYWLKLRTMEQSQRDDVVAPSSSDLRWVVADAQPRNYRSKITGKKLKLRQLTEIEKMVSGAVIYRK